MLIDAPRRSILTAHGFAHGLAIHPYLLPLISSAVLPAALALLVLRRPNAAGARALVALMVVVAGWSASYLIELASADAAVEVTLHRWTFVIGDLVPVAWMMFAAH